MIPATYTGSVYSAETATATTTTQSNDELGQDAFLKMFMAQMTNQNPLNPMDNTEFTAQLAQFSSLEQLTKIAESMKGISELKATMQESQIMDYIGKEVTISGNDVAVTNGVAGGVRFNLAGSAYVSAVVTDSSGKVVANEDLGRLSAGSHDFRWNATDLAGQVVDDGSYSVSFVATDGEGNAVGVSDLQTSGVVTGYTKDTSGNFYLLLGDVTIPLSDVLTVRLPTQSEEDSTTGENPDES